MGSGMARMGPDSLLSLEDVPGHRQQGQEAGLIGVLHLPEPLLVWSSHHVVLEVLWQELRTGMTGEAWAGRAS